MSTEAESEPTGHWLRRLGSPERRIPWIFLLIATLAGMYFVVIVPPGQGIDETNHFYRSYTITSGHLIDDSQPDPTRNGLDRAGGFVPQCVQSYMEYFLKQAPVSQPFRVSEYFSQPLSCDSHARPFAYFENTALESPVAYTPSAVGVAAGRLLSSQPWTPFFLGRVSGLIFYLAVVFLALRMARRGRLLLFVVACLPGSLQLAAQFSTDGPLIALSILLAASATRLAADDDVPPSRACVMAAVAGALLLGLIKPAYVLLAILPLLAPVVWRKQHRRTLVVLLSAAALGLVSTVGWRAATAHVNVRAYYPRADAAAQISHMAHDPAAFPAALLRTLDGEEFALFTVPGIIGSAGGNNRTGVTYNPIVGMPVAIPAFAVIIILLLTEYADLRPEISRRRGIAGAGGLATIAATFVLIYLSAYVAWNDVGAQLITQIQGRYFVPLIGALLVPAVILFRGRAPGRSGGAIAVTLFIIAAEMRKVHGIFL